jgi:hypothetical protein
MEAQTGRFKGIGQGQAVRLLFMQISMILNMLLTALFSAPMTGLCIAEQARPGRK